MIRGEVDEENADGGIAGQNQGRHEPPLILHFQQTCICSMQSPQIMFTLFVAGCFGECASFGCPATHFSEQQQIVKLELLPRYRALRPMGKSVRTLVRAHRSSGSRGFKSNSGAKEQCDLLTATIANRIALL